MYTKKETKEAQDFLKYFCKNENLYLDGMSTDEIAEVRANIHFKVWVFTTAWKRLLMEIKNVIIKKS